MSRFVGGAGGGSVTYLFILSPSQKKSKQSSKISTATTLTTVTIVEILCHICHDVYIHILSSTNQHPHISYTIHNKLKYFSDRHCMVISILYCWELRGAGGLILVYSSRGGENDVTWKVCWAWKKKLPHRAWIYDLKLRGTLWGCFFERGIIKKYLTYPCPLPVYTHPWAVVKIFKILLT